MVQRRAQALRCGAAATLLLLALLCLCSCRYTDVLSERYEDPVNGTLDILAAPQYQESPDAPQDPTKPASTLSASDNLSQQENTRPVFSASASAQGQTTSPQQQPDTDKNDEAAQGNEPTEEEERPQDSSDSSERGEGSKSEAGGEGDANATGDGDSSEAGDDAEGGEDGTGSEGGSGKVYNDGTYRELPEDVGSIAATGQYAVIVQMLAGKGGLSACDENTLASMKDSGAFGYGDGDKEGLDAVKVAWSGNGAKSGSVDLKALIKAKPDAVLTDGAKTALSAADTEALTKAGIDVVSAPRLGNTSTADEDIVTAVRLVGKLLASADTQYDTKKMASLYAEQHDAVLEACRTANGGYSYKVVQGRSMPGIYQGKDLAGQSTTELSETRLYTAFIDSWTTRCTGRLKASRKYGTASMFLNGKTMSASSGVGLSAICASDSFVLMDYYLQHAGVVDNSFDTPKPASTPGSRSLPYAIIPGNPQGLLKIEFSRRSVPSALWLSITGSTQSSDWTVVGDELFPVLLVRSGDIAKKVVSSAQRADGLYNVGRPYKVAVVPSGLAGSWADGTVESFLLAAWAYDVFQGAGKPDSCTAYLEDYCSVFYRCSYSDAFEDLHSVKKAGVRAGEDGDASTEGSEPDQDDEADEPAAPSGEDDHDSPDEKGILARGDGMHERSGRRLEPAVG